MTSAPGWRGVRETVRGRIHARDWPPGAAIPNEADLATELGCARATVNRALRALAEEGLLERRRRAGTRVALRPVARATLEIPVIREEVEATGARYGYRLIGREVAPGEADDGEWSLGDVPALRVVALHEADGAPWAVETRSVSLVAVPDVVEEPFDRTGPNEWLLERVPYTHGRIAFDAVTAEAKAGLLACAAGAPLLRMRRLTWDGERPITSVELRHAPGHTLRTAL